MFRLEGGQSKKTVALGIPQHRGHLLNYNNQQISFSIKNSNNRGIAVESHHGLVLLLIVHNEIHNGTAKFQFNMKILLLLYCSV